MERYQAQVQQPRASTVIINEETAAFRAAPDGALLWCNPAYAQVFGFHTPERLLDATRIGEHRLYVLHERYLDLVRRLKRAPPIAYDDIEIRRADRSTNWVMIAIHAVRDAAQAVLYIEGQISEIAEHRRRSRREFNLLDTAAGLHALVAQARSRDDLAQAVEICGRVAEATIATVYACEINDLHGWQLSERFCWSRDGRAVQVDSPSLQRIPYSPTMVRWHTLLVRGSLVVDASVDLTSEIGTLGARQRGSTLALPIMVRGEFWGFIAFEDRRGERVWSTIEQALLHPFAIAFGSALGLLRAEQSLCRSEERQHASLNTIDEVLIEIDAEGQITTVNAAWRRLTGFTSEATIGHRIGIFIDQQDAARGAAYLSDARRGAALRPCELLLRTASNTSRSVTLRLGATDAPQIATSVLIAVLSDVTTQREQANELLKLQTIDRLTGLALRPVLRERTEQLLANLTLAPVLLVLDLDGFGLANETLGHDAGDRLLVDVAARLRGMLPVDVLLARLAGGSFAMLVADPRRAAALAHAARVAIGVPFNIAAHSVQLGVSIGIASAPQHGITFDDLLRAASRAARRAATYGGGGIVEAQVLVVAPANNEQVLGA